MGHGAPVEGLVGGTPRPKGLTVEVEALESGGLTHTVAPSAVGGGSITAGIPHSPATLAGFALGYAPQLIAAGAALNGFIWHDSIQWGTGPRLGCEVFRRHAYVLLLCRGYGQ
jgi:hypothetical protein